MPFSTEQLLTHLLSLLNAFQFYRSVRPQISHLRGELSLYSIIRLYELAQMVNNKRDHFFKPRDIKLHRKNSI